MNEQKNLNDIIKEIKNLDTGITSVLIPILKDTNNDYRKIFNKLIIIIVILLIGLISVIGYSQYLISKQADKYNDFLSQFEFESEVYQDLETSDESSLIVNSGITYNEE